MNRLNVACRTIVMLSLFLLSATLAGMTQEQAATNQGTAGINWGHDFDKALSLAKSENKQILLDFFNPN